MAVVVSWNCNIFKMTKTLSFPVLSMGAHNLFQSEYIIHSCFNLCLKNLQKKWARNAKRTEKKSTRKIMDFNWNLPKQQREKETRKICMWFVLRCRNLFPSFFVFVIFSIFLFGFTPNFCSFFDLLLLKKTAVCVCINCIVSAYTYHICLCVWVRCSNRCVSVYKYVLAFVVSLSLSRQPLKMVDNISFWWQQTALQLQQCYQTYWKPAAVRWR